MTKPQMLLLTMLGCQLAVMCGWSVLAKQPRTSAQTHSQQAAVKQSKTEFDVNLREYLDYVQRRVKRVWYPPTGPDSKRASVAFKIHPNGTESHLRIEQTSRDEDLDASALLAVNDAAPFKELPKGSPQELDVRLTLSYAVGPNNSRSETVTQTTSSPPKPQKAPAPAGPAHAENDSVDFGPYMADVQRRIKRVWFPPKGEESKRILAAFKVDRAGRLSHLKIQKSSGVARADEAALKAVKEAAPFHELPQGSPSDVDIEFTFDYNVFHKSGSEKRSTASSPPSHPLFTLTISSWTEVLLGFAALICTFLPSFFSFQRKKKRRAYWLGLNCLLSVIFMLLPDMLKSNEKIGTGIMVVAAICWLLMLLDSMTDDRH